MRVGTNCLTIEMNMRKKIVPISKLKKKNFLRLHREYVLFLTDGPVVRPIWRKFAHF